MTFADRHSEYLWLTAQLFGDKGAMLKSVWDACEPDVQEDMLNQLRKPLRERQAVEQHYGSMRGEGGAW